MVWSGPPCASLGKRIDLCSPGGGDSGGDGDDNSHNDCYGYSFDVDDGEETGDNHIDESQKKNKYIYIYIYDMLNNVCVFLCQ